MHSWQFSVYQVFYHSITAKFSNMQLKEQEYIQGAGNRWTDVAATMPIIELFTKACHTIVFRHHWDVIIRDCQFDCLWIKMPISRMTWQNVNLKSHPWAPKVKQPHIRYFRGVKSYQSSEPVYKWKLLYQNLTTSHRHR